MGPILPCRVLEETFSSLRCSARMPRTWSSVCLRPARGHVASPNGAVGRQSSAPKKISLQPFLPPTEAKRALPALQGVWGVFPKIEELAQVDFKEPTPPAPPDQAVAVLKESIENVGFDVTVRMAQWTVSFEVLGMTCGSCVSTVDRALRTVEWPSVKNVRVNLLVESAQIVFFEPTDKSSRRHRGH